MKALVAAAGISLITGFGIAWNWQAQRWDADVAAARAQHNAQIAEAKDRGIAEGSRRQAEIESIAEKGRADDAKIDDRATATGGSINGLRESAAMLAKSASCDPDIARRGEAATRAASLLSDLLGKSLERNRDLAEIADRARERGLRCESAYEAVAGKEKPST